MLVLSRKTKQQIQIGPHVTITILKVKGETVRIGIEAPKDVCVLRSEVAGSCRRAERQRRGRRATVRSALASSEREKARAARASQESRPLGGRPLAERRAGDAIRGRHQQSAWAHRRPRAIAWRRLWRRGPNGHAGPLRWNAAR